MQRVILLHSNDIHARITAFARLVTLVDRIRAEHPNTPVLYVDAGDIEDAANPLSNRTHGLAMHRLLALTGCAAAAVGNGLLTYHGPPALVEIGAVVSYPLLLANLRQFDGNMPLGVQPTALLEAGSLLLGVVGVTVPMRGYSALGLAALPAGKIVRECAGALRQDGADAILVLSHLGLTRDRQLANELQADVQIIIGAHSHDLLPAGELVGEVFVAQAGKFAQHLGRIDLLWDGEQLTIENAGVLPIGQDIPPAQRVLDRVAALEGAR